MVGYKYDEPCPCGCGQTVTLPDGTAGFDKNDLQLAFQDALIAATGTCALEHEYVRAGFPELARLARGARAA